ncbi:MAG: hypothetical protein QOF68_1705 [Gaiellales bacterium]|nr:hypothetical protein [Gaiellales bacterium]
MTGSIATSSLTRPDDFRQVMRHLATGVVMVTTEVDGRPWGLTVSACCSVSLDPPMLLVSVAERTATAGSVRASGRFGVSILGQGLLEVARFGSAPGAPKFVAPYCVPPDRLGRRVLTPVVAGCLAHIDARVSTEVAAGDHVLYVGLVESVLTAGSGDPLVYFDGAYHGLGQPVGVAAGGTSETVDSLLYPHPIPLRFRGPVAVPMQKGA